MGYDDSLDPVEQFTEGQLDYCALQCRTLHAYFQTVMIHNTGKTGTWDLKQCAEHASVLSCGVVSARTIQSWFNHNYKPNKGRLCPRMSGKYERNAFVDWFVEQSDLLSDFSSALKVNVKEMSFKRAMQILNLVLQQQYEGADKETSKYQIFFVCVTLDTARKKKIRHAFGFLQ